MNSRILWQPTTRHPVPGLHVDDCPVVPSNRYLFEDFKEASQWCLNGCSPRAVQPYHSQSFLEQWPTGIDGINFIKFLEDIGQLHQVFMKDLVRGHLKPLTSVSGVEKLYPLVGTPKDMPVAIMAFRVYGGKSHTFTDDPLFPTKPLVIVAQQGGTGYYREAGKFKGIPFKYLGAPLSSPVVGLKSLVDYLLTA